MVKRKKKIEHNEKMCNHLRNCFILFHISQIHIALRRSEGLKILLLSLSVCLVYVRVASTASKLGISMGFILFFSVKYSLVTSVPHTVKVISCESEQVVSYSTATETELLRASLRKLSSRSWADSRRSLAAVVKYWYVSRFDGYEK